MAKQYKIVRATKRMLVNAIFECVILKDVKPPIWFTEFVEQQFKPLVMKVEGIDIRLEKLENRIDNIVQKNNLAE